jgi:uncharacterized repeat protein (TIGR01451 family)
MKQQTRLGLALVALAVAGLATTSFAQGGVGGGGGGGSIGGGAGGGGTATGADLQITGSASTGAPDPGAVYTYSFLVKNSGPNPATGVVLSDVVPAGTTPNLAMVQGGNTPCPLWGSLDGTSTWRCDLGTIAKGGQTTVIVSVMAPEVAQSIVNTATVTSATADPKTTNNISTVNVAVKAPTGGVCKGGVCDTVPPPVAAACAVLTSVTAPVGYYSVWAAVWNDFTIQSCSTTMETVTVQVTERNVATGNVEYDITYPVTLQPGQNLGMVLDNDFAPFNTTYDISYTVRDSGGTVLGTAATQATTPPQP